MDDEVKAPLEPPVEQSLDASTDAEEDHHVLQDSSRPYSCFSQRQKTCISFIASFSAMFSGLSSFIYYPVVNAISRSLHVSIELINLTITSYQIVSGIAPSILGDLADQSGRRPVCLIAFTLYFAANLGLALQNNYIALVVLRCLQSAGASSMSLRSLNPRFSAQIEVQALSPLHMVLSRTSLHLRSEAHTSASFRDCEYASMVTVMLEQ